MTMQETEKHSAIDASWWRQAAVYQIYPRSFADSNADSLGDLPGITSRVPYLKELGIDAVWLSPFYPSALADGGYDVDDYRNVDPRLGTLEDFDAMAAALHQAGIKVIVDIVPNHSSNRHKWFQAALASPKGSPERERYIFRDGLGANGELPPADWESVFGGPAWAPVGDGQWYLHLFAPEQPDFNWANPEVREDFLTTLRFWSDRGVDGFRVDVAHALTKDIAERDLPTKAQLDAMPWDGSHPIWDRDEVHEIYAEWRALFNEYTPPRIAVAEAWTDADRRPAYARSTSLGQAFNFDLLQADFLPEAFKNIITFNLDQAAAAGSSTTWVYSNHDVVRHATRYALEPAGDPEAARKWLLQGADASVADTTLGLRRARAATLLQLALPGSAYLYQGEELGLPEVHEIPDEQRQDPTFFRNRDVDLGRDGCRVPLPWESTGSSLGFGGGGAHLPQPAVFAGLSVAAQEGVPGSTLELYRSALALRRELHSGESLAWLPSAPGVLTFSRPNGWICITNFSAEPQQLPSAPLLASGELVDGRLPAATTAWLRG
ncbi:glycoside hydrolase family 13 protein [Glutamicibacter protophormiae]|uniref:glycoside hydrolase family 13 protein n=1 Tax=Glutamicibacter protophormiae TaxID=37930 RepID=UPI002A81A219|nr:glycoside hydrolase family 13 protein [Glutamicibacter protophormiae]WPR64480.1 glycoside hydrolase family 13 protein [Glutamicibacter protophormiae]WPR67974.1 glycoside hydrolase family 13 protein [Glutamicibacter protophormiae]